jgi:hypothetical protein
MPTALSRVLVGLAGVTAGLAFFWCAGVVLGDSRHSTGPATAPTTAATAGTSTVTLQLASGPFPNSGHPQAVVHVPPSFDPSGPVNLVIYLHCFGTCAPAVMGDTLYRCTPRRRYHGDNLADAIDASGKNAIVVALQLAWAKDTTDDGTLANDGAFKDVVTEILANLPAPAGPRTLADLGSIVLVSHSGGYVAAADILDHGGLTDHIGEVALLDSLYGRQSSFDAWMKSRFQAGQSVRFIDLYLSGAMTEQPSNDLAASVRGWLGFAAANDLVADGSGSDPITDATLETPIFIKAVSDRHGQLPIIYFPRVVDTLSLP